MIQLSDAIKELKEKMRVYKLHHISEHATGPYWDTGYKKEYMEMKCKYQKLEEKREKLLLET